MYNTVTVPPPFPSVYALNKHDPLLVHSGNYPPNNLPQSKKKNSGGSWVDSLWKNLESRRSVEKCENDLWQPFNPDSPVTKKNKFSCNSRSCE